MFYLKLLNLISCFLTSTTPHSSRHMDTQQNKLEPELWGTMTPSGGSNASEERKNSEASVCVRVCVSVLEIQMLNKSS